MERGLDDRYPKLWNYDGAELVICNFSPVAHYDYTVGVPIPGIYTRIFSTFDSLPGGGSPEEIGNTIGMNAVEWECDGRPYRITYSLRPTESVIIKFPW